MDLSGFNIWEIIVAALAGFVVGALWYSPLLFGKSWQQQVGLSDDDLKQANMPLIFGLGFVLNVIVAFALSFFVEIFMMLGSNAWLGGLFAGVLALVFVATTFGVNYLFARRSLRLYLIDIGYMVLTFFVMGVIIGAWH